VIKHEHKYIRNEKGINQLRFLVLKFNMKQHEVTLHYLKLFEFIISF